MSVVLASALNPLLTGPLLWAITRAPPQVQERVVALLRRLPFKFQIAKLATALSWLLGLGLIKAANNFANACALNGWRRKADKDRWNWSQEIAVITGGCSGIGSCTVVNLRAKGVRVAILDISPLPAKFENDDGILYVKTDVTDSDAVHAAADEVRSKLGKPSILLNNAGIGFSYPILDTPPHRLRKVMDVNLISHWFTCAAFVPDMVKANKGHVVTLASMASFITVSTTADYAATKAGVLSFHEALSASLRNQYNAPLVHTTSIHPMWVKTPLITGLSEEKLKKLGPLLDMEDVARGITKQIFSCRGGQLVLPASLWGPAIRAFPNWLQEVVRDIAGKLEMPE